MVIETIVNSAITKSLSTQKILQMKHCVSRDFLKPMDSIFKNKTDKEKIDLLAFVHVCKKNYNTYFKDQGLENLENSKYMAFLQLYAKKWSEECGVNFLLNGDVTLLMTKIISS